MSTTKASSSLTIKEKEIVRVFVKKAEKQGRGKYYYCIPEERAAIGMYAAENGPGRACKHFTKVLEKNVPESSARKLRAEYLRQLKTEVETEDAKSSSPCTSIKVLPTKRQGRPLLVGQKLDETIQGVIRETRKAGGVINTSVVVAMAMGIITSKDPSLVHENGGHSV